MLHPLGLKYNRCFADEQRYNRPSYRLTTFYVIEENLVS